MTVLKRRVFSVFVLLLVALCLAACNGSVGSSQSYKKRVADGKEDTEINRYYNGFGPYIYAASNHSP